MVPPVSRRRFVDEIGVPADAALLVCTLNIGSTVDGDAYSDWGCVRPSPDQCPRRTWRLTAFRARHGPLVARGP